MINPREIYFPEIIFGDKKGTMSCIKQITTSRVNYYTTTDISAVPFTLLSRKFKVLREVSQIGRDRITIGLSTNDGVMATVNLVGLPENPVLTYVLPIAKCNKRQYLVNQIFLLNPAIGPQPSPIYYIQANINNVGITIPANSEQPILYTIIDESGDDILSYNRATGRIIYLEDVPIGSTSPIISVSASNPDQVGDIQVVLYRQDAGKTPIQLNSKPLTSFITILNQVQRNILQGTQFFVTLKNTTNNTIIIPNFSSEFGIDQTISS